MKPRNKAFTLIELIVVMAIIAILVLLAAPSFLGYTKDAKVTAIKQDERVLSDAAERYYVENDNFPTLKDARPLAYNVGGVDEIYPIDSNVIKENVKNTKNDVNEYGIVRKGQNKGQVFYLNEDIHSQKFGLIKDSGVSLNYTDAETVIPDKNNAFKIKSTYSIHGAYIQNGSGVEIKPNTKYELSYKYKKTSGTLVGFGGHSIGTFYEDNKVYIDGQLSKQKYANRLSAYTSNDELIHSVKVVFKTPKAMKDENSLENNSLWIQPNRLDNTPVTVLITDLYLEELK